MIEFTVNNNELTEYWAELRGLYAIAGLSVEVQATHLILRLIDQHGEIVRGKIELPLTMLNEMLARTHSEIQRTINRTPCTQEETIFKWLYAQHLINGGAPTLNQLLWRKHFRQQEQSHETD